MKNINEIFSESRKVVCIQGLGFVGSAMALATSNARGDDNTPIYNVIGIDIPNETGIKKANLINEGIFPYENNDIKMQEAQRCAKNIGNLWATTESAYFQYADIVVVDINLDISYINEDEPILNLNYFKYAIHTLGHYIKPGSLVIIETTVPPGTCEKIVYPILCQEFEKRGLSKECVYIAHSYERVMPGDNYFDSIINYWRVYSGINEASADKCKIFLEHIINTENYPLTKLSNTTSTEIAKVLENSYRAATIAFMEEWGRFAEDIGVDLFEIVNAIRMRPSHSNMRQPGFGVGGYCLTKDPYFAPLAAKDLFGLEGHTFPFSTEAVRVNNAMPLVSLNKIENLLGGSLQGKNILVLGVSYRQDVGDTRYSPTERFAREALKRGARLEFQDPLVKHWKEMNLDVMQKLPEFLGYDAIVFTVQHEQYKTIDFKNSQFNKDTLIFDANCVLSYEQRLAITQQNNIRFASIGR